MTVMTMHAGDKDDARTQHGRRGGAEDQQNHVQHLYLQLELHDNMTDMTNKYTIKCQNQNQVLKYQRTLGTDTRV